MIKDASYQGKRRERKEDGVEAQTVRGGERQRERENGPSGRIKGQQRNSIGKRIEETTKEK